MINKLNELRNIEYQDLTIEQKAELAEHYYKQYAPLLNIFTVSCAKIIENNDRFALLFILDVINGLIKHTTDKLYQNEQQDNDVNFINQVGTC